MDGVLIHEGIPVYPKGVGILQIERGKAVRFIEFIDYKSTTMYPEEVFIDLQLTSVTSVSEEGKGRIIADVREIPAIAREKVEEILEELGYAGFKCVLAVSNPDADAFGISVSKGKIAIVITSGINPFAAIKEKGLKIYEIGYERRNIRALFVP